MKLPQDILKEAREKSGLTQTDIAAKIGIGLRMYQKIENGEFPKYKKEQIIRIDEILGTNLYEIIYEKNIRKSKFSIPKKEDSKSDEKVNNPLDNQSSTNNIKYMYKVLESDIYSKKMAEDNDQISLYNQKKALENAERAQKYSEKLSDRIYEMFKQVQATESSSKQTQLIFAAKLRAFREFLREVGLGKRYSSEEEIDSRLNNLFADQQMGETGSGTQSGSSN